MSGYYWGIRLYFYVLVVGAALLFLAIQVMTMGNSSPDLKLEDCDWPGQPEQKVIATAPQTLNGRGGDTSIDEGLGGAAPQRTRQLLRMKRSYARYSWPAGSVLRGTLAEAAILEAMVI